MARTLTRNKKKKEVASVICGAHRPQWSCRIGLAFNPLSLFGLVFFRAFVSALPAGLPGSLSAAYPCSNGAVTQVCGSGLGRESPTTQRPGGFTRAAGTKGATGLLRRGEAGLSRRLDLNTHAARKGSHYDCSLTEQSAYTAPAEGFIIQTCNGLRRFLDCRNLITTQLIIYGPAAA